MASVFQWLRLVYLTILGLYKCTNHVWCVHTSGSKVYREVPLCASYFQLPKIVS